MPDLNLTVHGQLDRTRDQGPALRRVAAQFESFFLAEIMRNDGHGLVEQDESLLDEGPAIETYRDLHRQALAEGAAGGLGIADLLVQQLLARTGQHDQRTSLARTQPAGPDAVAVPVATPTSGGGR